MFMRKLADKELANLMLADKDFEKHAAEKISERVDRELSKKNPDYDLIAELSNGYAELVGADERVKARSEQHINEIISKARHQKPRKNVRIKTITAVAAFAAFFFTANCISVAAFDMNIFKAVVKYTDNGFSVNFSREEPQENSDPYGIKAECEKYGIYPEVPAYLPKGLELTSSEYTDLGICKQVAFYYKNSEKEITMYYQLYNNTDDMSNTGIPSDYFNLEEIKINGRPAITSKEDNQYTLVYANNTLLLTLFAQNISYDECDIITKSIK